MVRLDDVDLGLLRSHSKPMSEDIKSVDES
jgi:hypothetical protein